MDLVIRSYVPDDAPELAKVFHRAVREGAATKYSLDERQAWSPDLPSGPSWHDRLTRSETVVAEMDRRPIGFMTLDIPRAYLDLAFVVPEVMGQGVADAIYAVLEGRARVAGLTRMTTEASLLAEPFFERQGWRLVARQKVERLGMQLSNAVMEKSLVSCEVAA